ncbi:MAG: tRNA (adenosine(37)-N6)-dimethylallyltransferase MiaA [Bacteroidota bacterium]
MLDCPPILALVGPTAVGKTGLSLHVAELVSARSSRSVEIISIDSRQVYKHVDIGTAKPSSNELSSVPHHFIDELEPTVPFSAGRFATEAEKRITNVLERGRLPLLVGGSTLYLEALVHGIASIPKTSPETRSQLTSRLKRDGPEALYEELTRVDPIAAASMDASKTQRIIRALEVHKDTGTPISTWQRDIRPPSYAFHVRVLSRTRPHLYRRIEARVDAMLDLGLLDEVRGLLEAGYPPTMPAFATIGYREPLAFLQGDIDRSEMERLLKRNSRRYAKRQLTWFRRRGAYAWHDVQAEDSTEDLSLLAEQLADVALDQRP